MGPYDDVIIAALTLIMENIEMLPRDDARVEDFFCCIAEEIIREAVQIRNRMMYVPSNN
jgi:hypothetical protein